ncbi:MAG: tetratricopeptide repeat protein [Phaeodactylibacter sp.]|nr:tetratricopeptide repeat protein [Phaeodactylibacter sp.]
MNTNNTQQLLQLNDEALRHYQSGNLEQALALARQACALAEEITRAHNQGENAALLLAKARHNLGQYLASAGQYEEAVVQYEEALSISRTLADKPESGLALTLAQAGDLYRLRGDYLQAEKLLAEAVEVSRKGQGEGHPDFALALNNLGVLHHVKGDFEKAKENYQRAAQVWGEAGPAHHEDYTTSLLNLSGASERLGDFQAARQFGQQALEASRQLPEGNSLRQSALLGLATLHQTLGEYPEAEEYYQQALPIMKKRLGAQHPEYARYLHNLGFMYADWGRLPEAERMLTEAKKIRAEALGENHPDYASSLVETGRLLFRINDLDSAEEHFRRAAGIYEQAYGEKHPYFAACLDELGQVFESRRQWEKAEAYYRRAQELFRQIYGEKHRDYAKVLNHLGLLYWQWEKPEQARPCLEQALQLREEIYGRDAENYAVSLNNLAVFLGGYGEASHAEQYLRKAIAVWRKRLGDNHSNLSRALGNLAIHYLEKAGRPEDARPLLLEALRIDERLLQQAFSFSSQQQALNVLEALSANFDVFLSAFRHYFRQNAEMVEAAFQLVLQRKQVLQDYMARQRQYTYGGRSPEFQSKVQDLNELRRQASGLALSGGADPAQLAVLRKQASELEAALARLMPELAAQQQQMAATVARVAAALPEGAVLVEFVYFMDAFLLEQVEKQKQPVEDLAAYLAFTLDAGGALQAFELGSAITLDNDIEQLRQAVAGPSSRGIEALTPEESLPTEAFHRLEPIWQSLPEGSRLILSPDQGLTLFPFEMAPYGQSALIDHFTISYIDTGRSLLRPGRAKDIELGPPLILADPDYGPYPDTSPEPSEEHSTAARREVLRSQGYFCPLPGARQEALAIGRLLGVAPILGQEANERHLLQCRSPRILHLATHGFFVPSTPPNAEPSVSAIFNRLPPDNPLLRSGLAFAGANCWLSGAGSSPTGQDGILTAEEVATLHLHGTELVVLSACQSGLGDIRRGEGVFGLRRAFAFAGARRLLISLWPVEDEPTKEFMSCFYELLLGGSSFVDALRQARLQIRERYPEPRVWAAFIGVGEASEIEW